MNTMKTTVEHNNKEQEIKYPFIGIADIGDIVLFHKPGKGVILKTTGGRNDMEYYGSGDSMKYFKSFNGKITLEND